MKCEVIPKMQQISPYPLWIGNAGDGVAFRTIFDRGIQAVVQLAAEEPTIAMPRDLIYCRFPLLDGSGNSPKLIETALTTVSRFIESETATLVCCGAGMSRSPVIAAAALALHNGIAFDASLQAVTTGRPADVAPAFASQVATVLKSIQEKS